MCIAYLVLLFLVELIFIGIVIDFSHLDRRLVYRGRDRILRISLYKQLLGASVEGAGGSGGT